MKTVMLLGKGAYAFGKIFVGMADCALGAAASAVLSAVNRRLDAAPLRAAFEGLSSDARELGRVAREIDHILTGASLDAPAQPATPAAVAAASSSELTETLRQAQTRLKPEKMAAALKAAKRSYLFKSLSLGLGVASLALATTATALTAGAAAPALVVSTIALRVAVANWKCARDNLERQKNDKPGLEMGSNAFANGLYQQYIKQRISPPEARVLAARGALVTTTLFAGMSLGVGVTTPIHAQLLVRAFLATSRVVQNCVTPVGEVATLYQMDESSASTAGAKQFEAETEAAWIKFLEADPDRARQYKDRVAQRAEYSIGPLLPSRGPLQTRVTDPDRERRQWTDIRPLLRWTRDTKQLNQLDTWLAKRADDTTWLDEIFGELDAVDQGKDHPRAALGVTAAGATASFGLALAKMV